MADLFYIEVNGGEGLIMTLSDDKREARRTAQANVEQLMYRNSVNVSSEVKLGPAMTPKEYLGEYFEGERIAEDRKEVLEEGGASLDWFD